MRLLAGTIDSLAIGRRLAGGCSAPLSAFSLRYWSGEWSFENSDRLDILVS
jgi:hypothetical protein